jgi:uncharacterized protein YkuJ
MINAKLLKFYSEKEIESMDNIDVLSISDRLKSTKNGSYDLGDSFLMGDSSEETFYIFQDILEYAKKKYKFDYLFFVNKILDDALSNDEKSEYAYEILYINRHLPQLRSAHGSMRIESSYYTKDISKMTYVFDMINTFFTPWEHIKTEVLVDENKKEYFYNPMTKSMCYLEDPGTYDSNISFIEEEGKKIADIHYAAKPEILIISELDKEELCDRLLFNESHLFMPMPEIKRMLLALNPIERLSDKIRKYFFPLIVLMSLIYGVNYTAKNYLEKEKKVKQREVSKYKKKASQAEHKYKSIEKKLSDFKGHTNKDLYNDEL